jgi:hypothetical protein
MYNYDPQYFIIYNNKDKGVTRLSWEVSDLTSNMIYFKNQKSQITSSYKFNKRENSPSLRPTNHIYFVICNSCYWCASYFCIDDLNYSSQVLRCHLCNSCNTELTPISSNESFRINYNVTRGMDIEFYRTNEIVNKQESSE